jgi:hypothetical protein
MVKISSREANATCEREDDLLPAGNVQGVAMTTWIPEAGLQLQLKALSFL